MASMDSRRPTGADGVVGADVRTGDGTPDAVVNAGEGTCSVRGDAVMGDAWAVPAVTLWPATLM